MANGGFKALIAARAAKELKDGDVVNLGIGIPTLVPYHVGEDVRLVVQTDNGIVDLNRAPSPEHIDPRHVIDAGGAPAVAGPGGSYVDSCLALAIVRGGHIDCTMLGALEVDELGNLSSWIIPGERVPGMGGAMDLVVGAKRVIVTMEHTAQGRHKILRRCRLPLTAAGCVDLIITEMGVIDVTPEGLVLVERNPAYSLTDIRAATQANLIISPRLRDMAVHSR